MAGVIVSVDLRELEGLQRRIDRLAAELRDPEDLILALSQILETQTKRRLADEKRSPDGIAWSAWSTEYAVTRSAKHSLLVNDQNLLDSVAGYTDPDSASVGSNTIYAAVHQFGFKDRNIPAREYFGLSEENVQEINGVVDAWLDEVLA